MDICGVGRIKRAIERHGERFLAKVFTPGEIEFCSSRSNPYPSYAARFAAKEAVMKLLGAGIREVRFTDVEVRGGGDVRPWLLLTGRAGAIAGKMGIEAMDLSISHEGELAAAVVFAIATNGGE